MGKKKGKDKRVKKEIILKTPEERKDEVDKMKQKLYVDFGLNQNSCATMTVFFALMDQFAEDGISISGNMDFPEAPFGGRLIQYIFSGTAGKVPKLSMPLKNRR